MDLAQLLTLVDWLMVVGAVLLILEIILTDR